MPLNYYDFRVNHYLCYSETYLNTQPINIQERKKMRLGID